MQPFEPKYEGHGFISHTNLISILRRVMAVCACVRMWTQIVLLDIKSTSGERALKLPKPQNHEGVVKKVSWRVQRGKEKGKKKTKKMKKMKKK